MYVASLWALKWFILSSGNFTFGFGKVQEMLVRPPVSQQKEETQVEAHCSNPGLTNVVLGPGHCPRNVTY